MRVRRRPTKLRETPSWASQRHPLRWKRAARRSSRTTLRRSSVREQYSASVAASRVTWLIMASSTRARRSVVALGHIGHCGEGGTDDRSASHEAMTEPVGCDIEEEIGCRLCVCRRHGLPHFSVSVIRSSGRTRIGRRPRRPSAILAMVR